jgi:hypothetical protein
MLPIPHDLGAFLDLWFSIPSFQFPHETVVASDSLFPTHHKFVEIFYPSSVHQTVADLFFILTFF